MFLPEIALCSLQHGICYRFHICHRNSEDWCPQRWVNWYIEINYLNFYTGTLILIYQSTWHHIPEVRNFYFHGCGNLNTQNIRIFFLQLSVFMILV
jgi:hypothetical protein